MRNSEYKIKKNQKEFEKYKPIRNQLRMYNKNVLLKNLIQQLHLSASLDYVEKTGYLPSYLFLLIKWLFLDWDHINSRQEKILTSSLFNRIIAKTEDFCKDFNDRIEVNSSYNLQKIVRKLAFQQNWLHQKTNRLQVGRSIEFLLELSKNSKFNDFFLNEFGLEVKKFIQLSLVTYYSVALKNNPHLSLNFYSPLTPAHSKNDIGNFIKLISMDVNEASKYSKELPVKSYYREVYEQSVLFKRYPFFRQNESLTIYHPDLIHEFIRNWIYDSCKNKNSSEFCTAFGSIFEAYIRKGLDNYKTSYIPEKTQKKKGAKKQVDFILYAENGNILIEAKAIEASSEVRELPYDESLVNYYKDSIVKGIVQAIDVSESIKNRLFPECNKENNFILIITYKELYLGDSRDIWNEFIEKTIQRKFPDTDVEKINPHKIFFISIDDFDNFLNLYKGDTKKMIDKLNKIIEIKKNPNKKLYVFGMYLKEDIKNLDTKNHYLVKNYKQIIKEIALILNKDGGE